MIVFAMVWWAGFACGLISPSSNIDISSPCIPLDPNYPDEKLPGISLLTQADVDAIAECTVFNGGIKIDPNFVGDAVLPSLEIVYGELKATLDGFGLGNLTGFLAPKLHTLNTTRNTQSLTINPSLVSFIRIAGISSLRTIWLPNLHNIIGSAVLIENLPALTNLSDFYFPQESFTQQTSISVRGTNISSLMVFDTRRLINFNIVVLDNENLDNLTLSIQNATDIIISGKRITIELGDPYFWTNPFNVTGATHVKGNLNVSGCQEYNSFGLASVMGDFFLHDTELKQVDVRIPTNGSLHLSSNSHLKLATFAFSTTLSYDLDEYSIGGDVVISDCPLLSNISLSDADIGLQTDKPILEGAPPMKLVSVKILGIGGSVNISNCSSLSRISFRNLETIGGDFNITHNPQLKDISDFSRLQTISGKVNLQGDLSAVELPLLEHAFNGFTLSSTDSSLDCSDFDRFYEQKFIRGAYNCIPRVESASIARNNQSLPASAPSDVVSTGAKIGIGIAVSIAGIGIVASIGLCWRRRQRRKAQVDGRSQFAQELPLGGHHEKSELPQGKHYEKIELPESEDSNATELPQGRHHERAEVPAISEPVELHE